MAYVRSEVEAAFAAIAQRPDDKAPFPVGRNLAEDLGYPPSLLDMLPVACVEAFCGVSNVSLFAEIPLGSTVLDLGCGAGLDTLIAAKRTGDSGRVLAVDYSKAMLDRAAGSIAESLASNVELILSDAESLPLADKSVDVAIVNGIFNLNPDRGAMLIELARVVRKGGALFAAELVLTAELSPAERASKSNWFS